MFHKPKIPDLVEQIKSILAESRGSLADNEIELLERACGLLQRLDHAETVETEKLISDVFVILLRFFLNPEALEGLKEWYHTFLE